MKEPPPPGRCLGTPQMGRGRGLWPPSLPQVGGSRARARALLLEMTERDHTQANNPVSYPLERRRGLRSPSPPHPGSRARIRALPPPPAPNAPSLGRARSRVPGTSQYFEAPYIFPILSLNVSAPKEINWLLWEKGDVLHCQ